MIIPFLSFDHQVDLLKKQYKIDSIADGIERAKMRMDGSKNIFEY